MLIDITQFDPEDVCPICLNKYGTNQAIFQTRCGHNFHNDCLNNYCMHQRGSIVCPVCRADVGDACKQVIRQGGTRTRLRLRLKRRKHTKRKHIKKRLSKRRKHRRM